MPQELPLHVVARCRAGQVALVPGLLRALDGASNGLLAALQKGLRDPHGHDLQVVHLAAFGGDIEGADYLGSLAEERRDQLAPQDLGRRLWNEVSLDSSDGVAHVGELPRVVTPRWKSRERKRDQSAGLCARERAHCADLGGVDRFGAEYGYSLKVLVHGYPFLRILRKRRIAPVAVTAASPNQLHVGSPQCLRTKKPGLLSAMAGVIGASCRRCLGAERAAAVLCGIKGGDVGASSCSSSGSGNEASAAVSPNGSPPPPPPPPPPGGGPASAVGGAPAPASAGAAAPGGADVDAPGGAGVSEAAGVSVAGVSDGVSVMASASVAALSAAAALEAASCDWRSISSRAHCSARSVRSVSIDPTTFLNAREPLDVLSMVVGAGFAAVATRDRAERIPG